VIKKGKRVNLAIRGVRWLDTKVAIITYLLAELSDLKIKIKKLYLDREFFSVSVIGWLIALGVPFIMPAIKRGKTGGINQFLPGKKSYKTSYKMSGNQGKSVTFDLGAGENLVLLGQPSSALMSRFITWGLNKCCPSNTCLFATVVCRYKKGKRGKKGIEYLVYVVSKLKASLTCIRENYRKRFGIESSYRLKNLCRIRTTNKKPTLRLLFVGISFLLVNIWVTFLWRKISQPRRGGRLIYRDIFPLKLMLSFLRQAVDQIFKVVDTIYIPLENASSAEILPT